MTTTKVRSDHAPRRVEFSDGFITWLPSTRQRRERPPSDFGIEILAVLQEHGPLTTPEIAAHLQTSDPRGRGVGHCCATMMCRGQVARWASDDLRVVRWRFIDSADLKVGHR